MRIILLGISILAAVGMLFAGLATVEAQDATPAAGRDVPDPSECQVEPRPPGFFEQLASTPAAEQATPVASPEGEILPAGEASPEAEILPAGREAGGLAPAVLPAGQPADEETVEAVTAAVREVIACFNAGDLERGYALLSDDLIRRIAAGEALFPVTSALFPATPVAVVERSRTALLEVREVQILEDGRVAAVVVTDEVEAAPEGEEETGAEFPEAPETNLFIFIKVGDRFLIDDFIEGVWIPGTPTAGTPTS